MLEENLAFNSLNDESTLIPKSRMSKNTKLIIYLICLNTFIIITLTFIIIKLFIKEKNDNEHNEDNEDAIIKVLKYDKDFLKPNITFNATFELVKVQNGMIGLLINDPYSFFSHVQLVVKHGYLMDTVGGLAHLGEHMIFGGSEKYDYYSVFSKLYGIKNVNLDAFTDKTIMSYYISTGFNYNYDLAIDLLTDAFKYPSYDENIIKKEIQPLNSEFYTKNNNNIKIINNIIRQLSNNKTSFNGFSGGNNDTLRPNESSSLSKKLKGFHMVVNRPENIFFVLYSNMSINVTEEYVKKYFNYKIHEFSDIEIDVEDKKKLEKNIKDIENIEIFNENLYQHGFYYKSNYRYNILYIYFYIGEVDYKYLQFDIIDYYDYLFNSKSLLDLLKEKEYIVKIEKLNVESFVKIGKNNVFYVRLILTDNGLNNVDEVLIIIYKYIEIMKKEGYKKELFDNFIKYKKNLKINNFRKNIFTINNIYNNFLKEIINNYRIYGKNQIFTSTFENNYDENKLKIYLNNIKYEKSFFGINTIYNETKLLESVNKIKLKYFNIDFLYGKIPNDFKNRINEYNLPDDLKMREINPYFSEKFEKEIPCYKQKPNKCKELNEFDYENESEYKGTLLDEEDKIYVTYYQIDKSSEAFIVNSYLKFNFIDNSLNSYQTNLIYTYLKNKISIINELETITIKVDNLYIDFKIKSFSDNTEKIIKDLINIIIEEPQLEDFNYIINSMKYNYIKENELSLFNYIRIILITFYNKGTNYNNNKDYLITYYDSLTLESFMQIYSLYIKSINSLLFKIAGNINQTLVRSIHNYLKEKIKITQPDYIFKSSKITSSSSYVINYYEKSKLIKEADNAIIIVYKFDPNILNFMSIFSKCLSNISLLTLRFNYSNAYTPQILIENNYLYIYEQGRYKEVTEMEDDINTVLSEMINGELKCENFDDIVNSFSNNEEKKIERTPDYLFNNFIKEKRVNKNLLKEKSNKISYTELIEKISNTFKNPQRYSILVARSDISDEDFKKMLEKRKQITHYFLNNNITIEHTDKIDYLKDRTNII